MHRLWHSEFFSRERVPVQDYSSVPMSGIFKHTDLRLMFGSSLSELRDRIQTARQRTDYAPSISACPLEIRLPFRPLAVYTTGAASSPLILSTNF